MEYNWTMDSNHTYYIINKIEHDEDVDGIHLLAGYYRYTYDLSGEELPHAAEFSTDRYHWSDCQLYSTLAEYQELFEKIDSGKKMTIERLEYIETVEYKGQNVPVFLDDYGQCFYCIYMNKVLAFGSFQDNYEDEIKALVDHEEAKDRK